MTYAQSSTHARLEPTKLARDLAPNFSPTVRAVTQVLPKCSMPCLATRCVNDTLTPLQYGETLAEKFKGRPFATNQQPYQYNSYVCTLVSSWNA
jgi:hypothetical protein